MRKLYSLIRARPLLLIAMLFCHPAQPEPAQTVVDPWGADAFSPFARTLLLQVVINGQQFADIVRAERLGDGRLVLPEDAWREMRLVPLKEKLPMTENRFGYALESIVGGFYTLDMRNMIVVISAPPQAFEPVQLSPGLVGPAPPQPAQPGFYVNYDLSATHSQKTNPYGALIEGIGFNGWGSAVAGFVARGGDSVHEVLRTETYWQRDLPADMETLVLGDAITSAGSWSRPARYAGLRWARDFSLQPGYITFPLPTIGGSAALPSTVDLLINNQRSQSATVAPGPFQLNNVPAVTGAGEINLVVTDALGVERLITQRYYASPRLLAPGLTDFSLEAGALRRNYLLQSADYGSGFVAGTLRYGLAQALTGEGRFEFQKERRAAGLEVAGLLGDLAVGRMALAHSNADRGSGTRTVLGLEHTGPAGGGSLQWERMSAQYSPFAEVGNEIRPKERMVAGFGVRVLGNTAVGFNYIDQTQWDGDRLQLASINLGVAFAGNMYLGAYATRRLDKSDGWSGGLSLVLPLGGPRSGSVSARRQANGDVVSMAEVNQATPLGPGWGWRLRASDASSQRLQAGATLNTNVGRFTAEANEGENNNAVRLGASGSVGWFEGLSFATRNIGQGSFAVVSVGDLADVPVYRSHQLAATTNRHGLALVPSLLPYQKNLITIDPVELPFDVDIQGVSQEVVPYARSGTSVVFPVKRSRNALLTLQNSDGTPVPEGARVQHGASPREFFVARHGEVYLQDLAATNEILVRWQGGSCRLSLRLAPDRGIEPRLGPLICAEKGAGQ